MKRLVMKQPEKTRGLSRHSADFLFSKPTVLFLLVSLALILYQRAWNFGFNSDAFVLLANSIKNPLAWDHTYHYMPVTASWLWLQYQVFGMHQAAYEILNIIQHGIMGWLVFLLGIRLDFKMPQALLAALFFVCAGSAYQVTLWSIVGSNYFVSGCFYLGGLMLFIKAIRRDQSKLIWLVSLLYALALLSHEQSISLLPLCYLYAFLMGGGENLWARVRRLQCHLDALKRISPLLLPLAAFLVMKYLMSLHATITGNFQGPLFLFRNLLKGIFWALSFRGSYGAIDRIINLTGKGALVFLWLLPMSLLIFLLLKKGKPREIFLALWALGQLLMMALAIGISIRHVYLPTIAASLLVVGIGCRMTAGLLKSLKDKGWFPQRLSTHDTFLFCLLAFPIFFVPSIKDTRKTQDYWKQADTATRNLEQRLITLSSSHPSITKLTILDATKNIRSPGFEIYSFQNGLGQILSLLTPKRFHGPIIAHTHGSNIANGSRRVSQQTLGHMMQQPGMGVLRFNPTSLNFHLLDRKELKNTAFAELDGKASFISSETMPDLAWQDGTFPWLDIPPKELLSAMVSTPGNSPRWIIVHSLDGEGSVFRFGIRGKVKTSVRGSGKREWQYHLLALRAPLGPGDFNIFIRNLGSNHLNLSKFGLLPERTHYSGGTTPEFEWNSKNALEINPGTALRLPLAPCESSDCRLILTWLALPGHDIKVRTSTGLKEKLEVSHRLQKKWQTAVLLQGAWARGHIQLQAIGKHPAQIRQVRGFQLAEHPELLKR